MQDNEAVTTNPDSRPLPLQWALLIAVLGGLAICVWWSHGVSMRIRDAVWIGSMTTCFCAWLGRRSTRQVGATEARIWAIILSLCLGITVTGFCWDLIFLVGK